MASSQVTLGNKLSMATQAFSLVAMLIAITLAWGRMDTRMTVVEGKVERHENQLAQLTTQGGLTAAALATLAGKIEVQNATLSQLTTAVNKFDDKVERLRPPLAQP
ncbi:MAG: hypothetical protein J0I54_17645 [Bosea sp.]|uniref:hypothetical protein n=1 Tax=unclassified Bosea (in: a-proteobacteria) TaxID=2653178 RepID=UPI000969AC3F|nr:MULTISPECIES: hypothetical protein [unclassified Bosea (in: a-proteobacteria)]MBN9443555.1 hypothetical protein [Bosea sp. (in: a-proteobacteria)]MBN9458457.1 hypothetical protein [Bosea sp. (in: a-proteobacteria)]OJV06841.1 MAG: hypothetical protein BGO20_00300 [Bosea sp. 67-29]